MITVPEFDGHATDFATLEVLRSLVMLEQPKLIVEAGTYRGHGAIWMASAQEAGLLLTADVEDRDVVAAFEAAEVADRIEFHHCDFLQMLEDVVQVDFAFIDATDHSRPDGADLRWQHFQAVGEKLTPGGIICVHDTAADDWRDGQGGKSVLDIRRACQLNLTAGRGLSIYKADG